MCDKAISFTSGSVQETTQMQIKLQQAQSAKALCEKMNQVLQVSTINDSLPSRAQN